MHDVTRWWVAPPEWRGLAALGGVQYARFAFALGRIGEGKGDHRRDSLLTGVSRQHAILRWKREPAGSAGRFAKFVGKQGDLNDQLAALGFVRDHYLGASFHLPLAIGTGFADAATAPAGTDAPAPLSTALRAAHAAAPLLKPLVEWTIKELER